MQIEINPKEIDFLIKIIEERWLYGFEDEELESIYRKIKGAQNDKS